MRSTPHIMRAVAPVLVCVIGGCPHRVNNAVPAHACPDPAIVRDSGARDSGLSDYVFACHVRGFAGVSVDEEHGRFIVYISRPDNEAALRAYGDSLMRAWQRDFRGTLPPPTLELRPVAYDLVDLMEARAAVMRVRGPWSVNGIGLDVLRNRVFVSVDKAEDSTRLRAALRQDTRNGDMVRLTVGRIDVGPAHESRARPQVRLLDERRLPDVSAALAQPCPDSAIVAGHRPTDHIRDYVFTCRVRGFAGVAVDQARHLFFVYISRPENEQPIRAYGDSLMRAHERNHGRDSGVLTLQLRPVRFDWVELMNGRRVALQLIGDPAISAVGISAIENRVKIMVAIPADTARIRRLLRQQSPYAETVAFEIGREP